MGRRSQFFIIAAVIIILNLLAMSSVVRQGYRGSSIRPAQETSLVRDFNETIVRLYSEPYSFKRNIESFQLGVQKGSGFSSQIFLLCSGKPDCTQISVGNCTRNACLTSLRVSGPSMQIQSDFKGIMGR